LVTAINQGLVVPCFSAEILEEYTKVLLRPRFGFSRDEIRALLDLLNRRGSLLESSIPARVSPDPDDDKFIGCAMATKADFLVTGNKRHFPESQYADTRVVNAGELLEAITLGI
jgi:putative PIN family toxin of toxin-antitoxin system